MSDAAAVRASVLPSQEPGLALVVASESLGAPMVSCPETGEVADIGDESHASATSGPSRDKSPKSPICASFSANLAMADLPKSSTCDSNASMSGRYTRDDALEAPSYSMDSTLTKSCRNSRSDRTRFSNSMDNPSSAAMVLSSVFKLGRGFDPRTIPVAVKAEIMLPRTKTFVDGPTPTPLKHSASPSRASCRRISDSRRTHRARCACRATALASPDGLSPYTPSSSSVHPEVL
mmetsp:Transcript_8814/g.18985  ORF Transcript_8814/g.18985 Transcript_8814/m.18985 type:complete len:234 (+) Transcript_8814:2695-3396(+)